MDWNFITARLATGSLIATPLDVDKLIGSGVTHIIDCVSGWDDQGLLAGKPVVYLYNGTNDDGQPKSSQWFEASITFALLALSRPKSRIYAHCSAGINRGPSTAYAILRALGFSSILAEKIIRDVRPQVGLRYKNDADLAVNQLGYT